MSKYNGNSGVIQAVTTGGSLAAVGQVKNFTVETTAAELDATSMGDAWDVVMAGRKSWSGSLEAHYDPADTAQIDLLAGESVDLDLRPEAGNKLTGTAIVTTRGITVDKDDIVSVSISFKGTGALTPAAVT